MNRAEEGIASGTVLLGKYRVDEKIGRGGMGLVYRAHHLALDEQVAIKILRANAQMDEESVQRFQREAQAAVRLKSEHVARISDVGTFDDGSPYMVMEFLAGADLGSIIDTHGPMPVGQAVDLVIQACDALAEAHSLNIVHRDVKPTNLFVTTRPDGAPMVKILDFGISKSAQGTDLSLTQTASVLGTPAYMSPEQMRSARRVDGRTDIWSLGTVLYELVEGRRPFSAETFSEMCVMAAADPHDPMVYAPQLEGVIAACLAKTPEERYPTMAELARDLAQFASDRQRANFYVGRIYRVLGRSMDGRAMTPVPIQRPTPVSGVTPLPLAPLGLPGIGTPKTAAAPAAAPATLTTVADPPRRSRRKLVIASVALATLSVVVAVSIVSSNEPPGARAGTIGSADPETASKPTDIVAPGSGSATGLVGSATGSAVAAGSADGSVGSATGSDNSSADGSASAGTAAGSGSATVAKTGSGSGGKIKKSTNGKRGSATASISKGSGDKADPKKGSAGSDSASGSAVPTAKGCRPFESARPCPKPGQPGQK